MVSTRFAAGRIQAIQGSAMMGLCGTGLSGMRPRILRRGQVRGCAASGGTCRGPSTMRRPAPVRLVCLCAGQGHHVVGVLPGHPRRDEVTTVLVEADPRNAQAASRRAGAGQRDAGTGVPRGRQLAGVVRRCAAPGILLLCGIFGNVGDADIERTEAVAPALCAPGRDGDLDPAPSAA